MSIVSRPNEKLANQKEIKTGFLWMEPDGNELAKLGRLIEDGKLKPYVGQTFPFTEEGLKEAHRLSETHHAKGKIAIQIK